MHKHAALVALLSLLAFTVSAQDDFIEGQARPETVSIGRMPKPPALDGSLTGWPADATSIVLGSATSGLRRHFNWTGTRDLSAAVRLAWDNDALYLAEDVVDDKLVQVTNDKEIYQGDSIELFFNISPNQYRVSGFWQIAIAPPLVPGAKLRVVGAQKPFEDVQGNAKVYPGGYTLECRIPWKNLTGFTPVVGQCLGVQIMIDDRDGNGRKSQQIWYPSSITYSHATHTNIVRLAYRGDTSRPRIAAGPNTWCVTDPKKMAISLIADVPGGKNAVISLLSSPQKHPPLAEAPQLLTIPLEQIGPRVSIAQGAVTGIDDLDGLCNFGVTITDDQGKALATGNFESELSAKPFGQITDLVPKLSKRIDALAQNKSTDPKVVQGLNLWMQRCKGLLANDVRPESASRWMLDQLVVELNAMDAAITKAEAGGNPYDGMTGDFVEAYTSPLSGASRPLGLLIPANYDAKSAKRWPLVFLLHGIFADERQLFMMAHHLRDLGAIVCQAPAYRPLDWGGVSAAESWKGLDIVLKQYKIDPDRVYLIGHSIGGRGALQMAEGRPDLWAACAAFLTGADTGPKWDALRLYPQYYKEANDFQVTYSLYHAAEPPKPFSSAFEKDLLEQASLASRVDNIVTLPLRHSYGAESPDTAAERLAMFDRFAELGAPIATHEDPGAAHGSQPEEWLSPAFYQWLLSNRRPPMPTHVRFVANGLRYNSAWWVTVDQLPSPAALGRIEATLDGPNIEVKTSGLSAFTLNPPGDSPDGRTVAIDGQDGIKVATTAGAPFSFMRGSDGKWKAGIPDETGKRHGLSGPIDDFQFDRFLVVYGTQGDEASNALLLKISKHFPIAGLDNLFECKADRDVTDGDIQNKHLLLLGTPQNNSVLAKMKDALLLKWNADTMSLGKTQVSGAGSGACFIQPDPLAPGHYVVVVSANDEDGYGVWAARGPSDDYLIGNAKTVDGKPAFTITAHGCFDNKWHWVGSDCVVMP